MKEDSIFTGDGTSGNAAVERIGVNITGETVQNFMNDYSAKISAEGYKFLDELGGTAGNLYGEFNKVFDKPMQPGEIYVYSKPHYKLVISRGELGIMASFTDRQENMGAAAYYSRGTAYYQKKDYNCAISELTQAVKLEPNNAACKQTLAAAYHNRGIAYYNKRDYDSAIADYTRAIAINPNDDTAYCNRGLAYQYGNKGDNRAVADYTQAITLKPNHAFYYCRRGMLLAPIWRSDDERECAIADLSEAIRLNPNYAEAYCHRGYVYMKKDIDRSIADFTEAIRISPNDTFAYSMRGGAFEEKKEYDKAIADYSEIIRLKPNGANAYHNRADVYLKKGDHHSAIADYEAAVRLAPDNVAYLKDLAKVKPPTPEANAEAEACVKRAEVCLSKDNSDQAIAEYTEAIRINPGNAAAYFYSRGMVHHRNKKDYDKAVKDFEAAVNLSPDDDDYREYLERAKTAKERGK